MYFKKITLNESLEFTINNLIDAFTIPYNEPFSGTEEKLKRVRTEFWKYYDISKEAQTQILQKIEEFVDKGGEEPIDLTKIESFHHIHLRFQIAGSGTPLADAGFIKFYTIFFRSFFQYQLPSMMTKYHLPFFIDGKYLIFIVFDEKSIDQVLVLTSENQLDIRAPIYLSKLPIDKDIFKKYN